MRSPALIPLSLLFSFFDSYSLVYALRLPFNVKVNNHPRIPSHHLGRRAATTIPIANNGNAEYISNITLGGTPVRVLLDTGSSDLWVNFPSTVPDSKDLGKAVTLNYAVGKAAGNVHTIQLDFDGYTVQDQAFLLVTDTTTFNGDIHDQGYDGLLGLGPNDASVILDKIDDPSADSMLSRIFEQDKTTDNYITILLDRKNDPTDPFTGQFTISEVVPGFENITSMPKMDVEVVHEILEADLHWQALTDKDNGIIGPDGQPIQIDSIVPKSPDGQLIAVFDSGYTFSQVPRAVSDAIYGRVQGAVYDSTNEYWTVPCGQILNLTFNFGGRPYPIHPLDVVDDNFHILDATGNKVCIGAFQPITSAFSILGQYDMIMGMSFLRNAYTLLDFGNWIDGSNDKANPYIQLASITTPANARSDFIQARLGGVDTTNATQWALLPADQMQHSPVSAEEKKKMYQEMILSRWPYILLGCLVFVILVTGLCVWRCCCRKNAPFCACCRGRRGKNGGAAVDGIIMGGKGGKKGVFLQEEPSTSYLPLQEHGGYKGSHDGYASTTDMHQQI